MSQKKARAESRKDDEGSTREFGLGWVLSTAQGQPLCRSHIGPANRHVRGKITKPKKKESPEKGTEAYFCTTPTQKSISTAACLGQQSNRSARRADYKGRKDDGQNGGR